MADPDLHTRLRSAIEARLTLAQAATVYLYAKERWRFDSSSSAGPRLIVGPDERQDVWTRECNPSVWTCDDEQDGCPDEARGWVAEGQHQAANDPTFVIRACRAELAIVELWWAAQSNHIRPEGVRDSRDTAEQIHDRTIADALRLVVTHLAEVYGIEVA